MADPIPPTSQPPTPEPPTLDYRTPPRIGKDPLRWISWVGLAMCIFAIPRVMGKSFPDHFPRLASWPLDWIDWVLYVLSGMLVLLSLLTLALNWKMTKEQRAGAGAAIFMGVMTGFLLWLVRS